MLRNPQVLVVSGDGVALEALWWRPIGQSGPGAAVVLSHPHGGDAYQMSPMGEGLCSAGYHVVSVSMRGFGRSEGLDDCGFRQTDDQVAVVRWLASQPEIDATRIGLWGRSQGGQVALLAAAKAALMIRAVVAWNPVTDINHWRQFSEYPGIPEYIDATCSADTSARSPLDHASSFTAAVLLVHGAIDTRVPTDQSRMMAERLRHFGVHVEVELMEGRGHQFGHDGNDLALQRTVSFFDAHLRGPLDPDLAR